MEIDQELVNSVKGFLDEDEGRCLYEIALKAGSKGPCLEIGSYCGKSTLYLGAACRNKNSILFSIDPDLFNPQTGQVDTFREFKTTIERAGIEDTIVPIVCRSEVAARRWATPLSLIFIDGGHSIEAAYNDYNSWAGHIIPGGYLLIHDIFFDPYQGGQAPYQIYKSAIDSGFFRRHSMVKTLGVLQRQEKE